MERINPFDASDALPESAAVIIGAGRFGKRAAEILIDMAFSPIFLVDNNRESLENFHIPSIHKVLCDGVVFLHKNYSVLHPSNAVIPAVPIHLAFEWLRKALARSRNIEKINIPADLKTSLPHTWEGSEGSLLISYADFRCPDDCSEPEEYCTITGKRRGPPLYELLGELTPGRFRTHIIRSLQLAPGLGGYKVGDMAKCLERIREGGKGQWLVGTACRCHGTLTALEIH